MSLVLGTRRSAMWRVRVWTRRILRVLDRQLPGGRLPALLLILGVLAIAYASWIHVKAQLSQVLLRVAWQRTLAGEVDAKPWPWADTKVVARIVIERDDSDFIVLEGANGRALAFAPTHLEHTPMPGERGNCVITAHRDTHFATLRGMQEGDVVKVQRGDGRWFRYTIEGMRVVDEREVEVTRGHGEEMLTLVTCYPFDALVPGGRERAVFTARSSG